MEEMKDGHKLDNGIVVSRAGGYCVAVYRCACRREQTASYKGFSGGILPETAERLGWRKIKRKWTCPFCTGNKDNLNKLFNGYKGKERIDHSYGKFKIGDRVTYRQGDIGTVSKTHKDFWDMAKGFFSMDGRGWLNAQRKPFTEEHLKESWYSISNDAGGSSCCPESLLELL